MKNPFVANLPPAVEQALKSNPLQKSVTKLSADMQDVSQQADHLRQSWQHQMARVGNNHQARTTQWLQSWMQWQTDFSKLWTGMNQPQAWNDWKAYATDATQRWALTLDTLRQRADNDRAHEDAGTPPVLKYEHELLMDGRDMPKPVNYQLLRIVPPEGVVVHDWKRPYMIIDPRAGHGAGIGGFKPDSQVGVALRGGHPVYFVVFRQHPEPGQTLADVMRAEAEFLRFIAKRHPKSPKPVVVGNCQGGWASLVLAASNPDIIGPIVVNGAPVATWSGQVGENPMRYNGGLLGGILPALLLSDLGNGEFDGAHLVSNFELLNPARNFFGKYYDLYANVDQAREAFLEFEKWWGGFHFTNEAEIRWIIEQIFIGNRLARGQAQLEPGHHLDLKAIRSPIIVFASRGDNITPPQQALNWILDTYTDENEIRVRGQRIVYMVHENVGHLGIFVSSSIARKEHAEMASTLKTIEALAPGLYEMHIESVQSRAGEDHFEVSFTERKFKDVLEVVPNDREEERDFAAVARLSQMGADWYELTARPIVQSLVTPQTAELLRQMHPSRLSRNAFASQMPGMQGVTALAKWAREHRQAAGANNPWTHAEKLWAQGVQQGLDLWRDVRDALYESNFLAIYGLPQLHAFGKQLAQNRTQLDANALRFLPEVQARLINMGKGGLAEAVVRMLVLLADKRGSVRRDRLERSSEVLTTRDPFKALGPEGLAALIHAQSIVAEFEPDLAVQTLPHLLPTAWLRETAMGMVNYIVGERNDMETNSRQLIERMQDVLDHAELKRRASDREAKPVVAQPELLRATPPQPAATPTASEPEQAQAARPTATATRAKPAPRAAVKTKRAANRTSVG